MIQSLSLYTGHEDQAFSTQAFGRHFMSTAQHFVMLVNCLTSWCVRVLIYKTDVMTVVPQGAVETEHGDLGS